MSDTMFLLGAGASQPLGLPVTKGFFSNYNPPPTLSPLFNFICNCLADNKKEELDLEAVFALLSFYKDISSNVELNFLRQAFQSGEIFRIASKNIYQHFNPAFSALHAFATSTSTSTDVNALVKGSEKVKTASNVAEALEELSEKSRQLDKDIKHYVYTAFSRFEADKAISVYEPIFAPVLKKQNGKLTIFTTNYDLILENVFNTPRGIRQEWAEYKVENIYLGFQFRILFFIFEPKFQQPPDGTVEIYKLHGSLNWDELNGYVFMGGAARLPKDPEVPAFIYPGYRGIPEKEPFRSLHYLFAQRLLKTEQLMVIGYSFRDVYINTLILQSLAANDNLKIYVFTPWFPPDSGFRILQRNFADRVFHIDGKVGQDNLWDLVEGKE
ncbi:MAG: SIR2 family protein [Candidatus Magnetoovum sp. WYHC-5]|nr:SIR2 family protein [Candidatus Magnetoovum sp. WYHC-5]